MNEFMSVLIVFRLTFGGPDVQNPEPDRWFAEDKLQHFFLSLAATNLGFGAARTVGLDKGAAMTVAGSIGVAAGVGKEVYDKKRGGTFSGRDLVWDGLGIGAGLTLASQAR